MDVLTPDNLFQVARCEITEHYFTPVAATVFLADYLHTLPLEVSLIWPSEWSFAKILFLLNRYWVLDIIFRHFVDHGSSPSVCRMGFISSTTFAFFGFLLSEAIMFLRLFALSGRNRWMGGWLGFQFFILHFAPFVAVCVFIRDVEYEPSPIPSVMPCLPVAQGSARWKEIALYSVGLGSHTQHRSTKSSLLSIFYRDGLIYFLGLAITSLVNIVISATVPFNCDAMFLMYVPFPHPHLHPLLPLPLHSRLTNFHKTDTHTHTRIRKSSPQRTIHAILANRAILHLREQGRKDVQAGSSTTLDFGGNTNGSGGGSTTVREGNRLRFGSMRFWDRGYGGEKEEWKGRRRGKTSGIGSGGTEADTMGTMGTGATMGDAGIEMSDIEFASKRTKSSA
ncbi:hypothetical protein CC1G_15099 [Coprinopsis cinerea okayama7|uniref:DUF6533 domain-containing protein n=1 Tax=Coprinopsis cinerea (strain Okayama-7 / 130 / ATCC MYA-4618 / FGSC 9003) TaxID=240176 RepID=D6RNZ5_COPC7|nr:hypothetical protein CC1G_15099 [Coprinopsis cinerea okayama7\|eukprot:XP_002910765.1 hypothetical protein CC1G_15099 [Coprinopsis cinerea okayama7\